MLRIWRTSSAASRSRITGCFRPSILALCDSHTKSFATLPEKDEHKGKPGVWAVMKDILSAGKRDKAAAAAGSTIGNKEALKRVLGLMKPEVKPLTLAVGSLGVTTAISLVFPAAVGQILDYSLAPTATMSPITIAVGMFGLFAVQTVFMGTRTTLLANMGERIVNRLRKDMFSKLLDQDVAYFDANRTGDLINRLSADAVVVQKALTNNVASGLKAIFMVVGGTGMLVFMSPSLALLSVAVIPPVAVVGMLYGKYVKRRQKAVQAALGTSMEAAEELVSNIRTVKLFAQEGREKERFGLKMDAAYEQARQVGVASGWFEGAVHLAANMSLLTVLGYGGTLVVDGALTAGELTSFIVYSIYVGVNFSSLSAVYADLMKAIGAGSRIFEVMDRQPQLPVTGGETLDSVMGQVTFENVTFAYPLRPERNVLADFNMTVDPGKVVAIVGGSGSGKSTIGALLCRLYDPQSGRILLDGVDIRTLDPQWLRRNIGVVSQEPILFATSIHENIRYAKPDATDAEVQSAAHVANAHGFISSFPQGYQTLVGERGVQLSGGQKQRIAIARLVLKDPPVVLLDEATSALDAESEFAVQDALNRAMNGRTVLSIAHRISTVRASDEIAVLQDGKVVEQESFDDLLSNPDSAFNELMQRQLK